MRVVRSLNVMTSSSFLHPSFLLPPPRRTSSAASLDCTCQFLIAVGLAGLLQSDSFCGPSWAFTARKPLWASPDFLLWASPDFYGSKIAVGFAGLFAPRISRWASPDFLRLEKTQKECQIRMPDQNARRNARENVRWTAS